MSDGEKLIVTVARIEQRLDDMDETQGKTLSSIETRLNTLVTNVGTLMSKGCMKGENNGERIEEVEKKVETMGLELSGVKARVKVILMWVAPAGALVVAVLTFLLNRHPGK